MTKVEDIHIRPARPEEYDVVAAVKIDASRRYGDVYVTRPLPRDVFDKYVAQGGVIVAADQADKPCGYAIAYAMDDDLYLRHLFVKRDCGQKGIGASLLRQVIQNGTAGGTRAVTLTTGGSVPWNAPFYERHGFVILRDIAAMPKYLAKSLNEEILHFSPANFPLVLTCPELLPRVAMERLAP